ncbi:NAD-dependent epimerase/dehydratase family protein [Paenibacillus sp. MBLB4367]|uniref:NAD-dependent epimerase/dehydratase family protein n=1 Tax=Paenibacillus sp. MBLB4367 TaxID=3384767 RepID=UPI0039082BF8
MQKQVNPLKRGIRVLITGVTGMVGEGVLHECLLHPEVEQVLVVNRRPCGVKHPKLTEILHADFLDLTSIADQLQPYDACFFCLGVSSVGLKEEEYSRLTYDLTLHMAKLLSDRNPNMVFCYVSGIGTDSTEQGKSMWARVKGRTENHLMQLPFKKAHMFRPGYIHPTKGLKHTHKYYTALSWLYPVLRRLLPRYTVSLKELGLAMIHTATQGYDRSIVEPKDIVKLAEG